MREKVRKKNLFGAIIDHETTSLILSNELLAPSGRESNEKKTIYLLH